MAQNEEKKVKFLMRKNKGFTLTELLIVVAIISVLVAISIPIFSSQLHKAKVATDWANLRSYYAEIQADYISTGEYNPKIKVDWSENHSYDWHSITLLNGKKIEMKTGICAVSFTEGSGYSIEYECNKGDTECHLSLPVK